MPLETSESGPASRASYSPVHVCPGWCHGPTVTGRSTGAGLSRWGAASNKVHSCSPRSILRLGHKMISAHLKDLQTHRPATGREPVCLLEEEILPSLQIRRLGQPAGEVPSMGPKAGPCLLQARPQNTLWAKLSQPGIPETDQEV